MTYFDSVLHPSIMNNNARTLQIAFGILKLSQLPHEFAVGILICASVPGGGLGYLIVVVTGTANTELSVAINFLHIFIVVGK